MNRKEADPAVKKKPQPKGFGGGADRGLAPAGLFLTSDPSEPVASPPMEQFTIQDTDTGTEITEKSPLTELPSIKSPQKQLTLDELKKTLVQPLGLKHRPLELTEEQKKELERNKQFGKTGSKQKSIEDRLKGLPGGLGLSTEDTAKYFGDSGRAQFFERYQWMNKQMRITSKNSKETVEKLIFSEGNAKLGKKEESDKRPFGASRASSRASSRATRRAMRNSASDGSILNGRSTIMGGSTIATRDSDFDRDSFMPDIYAPPGSAGTGFSQPFSPQNVGHDNGMEVGGLGADDVSMLSNDGDNFSINTADLPALHLGSPMKSQRETSPQQQQQHMQQFAGMDDLTVEPGDFPGATMDFSVTGDSSLRSIQSPPATGSEKPGKSLASHNFFTTLDDDFSESDDSADDEFYSGAIRSDKDCAVPTSPRSRYIARCLQKATNPRASLMVRKKFGKSLELQHHGIGDNMAEIFAASVTDIPFVQSINLADNNLTDKGLGPILLALVQIEGLLEINLSQNVIGPNTAEALATYLANPACPLERLVLTKADIDDFECERFLNAIKGNRVLKELDLSNNLLGSAENLNTVMPDLITAGEALAELIRENLCAIETLKLGWNMLRLDGAIELCESLATNMTLTFLDLSYNSLGHDGGLALGAAIINNTMLETLLVENNALDACAALTICVGVIENRGLKRLAMDGNAIGVAGAKALMLVPTIAGQRVKVSASRCNVTIRDEKCWFDFGSKMLRKYTLDMEHPFDRAVLLLLLHFVASHRSFTFDQFDYEEAPRAPKVPITLVQARSNEPEQFLDEAQMSVISNLRRVQRAANNVDEAVCLFHEIDVDGSGELDKEELTGLLENLGLHLDEARIDDIMRTYDLDGGGTIGIDEFLYFLKEQNKEASARIQDILEAPIMTLEGDPNHERYIPPTTGRMHIEVVDGFNIKEIHRTLSSCDRDYINDVAAKTGDALVTMTSNGVEGFKVRLDEGLNLYYTMMRESRNKVLVLAKLLPQMSSQGDARELVVKALNNDTADMLRLKRNMGSALGPMLSTVPTGFYALDLSKPFDRLCLERLIELSATKAFQMRQREPVAGTHIGDISQKMNYQAFRNETFNGKRVTVDVDFGRPIPTQGHLCFDFCVENDAAEDALIVGDDTIVNILAHNFLLRKEDEHIAIAKLHRWRRYCDKALQGDAVTIFEPSFKRAMGMGKAQGEFDEHLLNRSYELKEAAGKEEIKVTYDDGSEPPDDSPAFPLKLEDIVIQGESGLATVETEKEKELVEHDVADDRSVMSNASSTDGEKSETREGEMEDELGLVNAKEDAYEIPHEDTIDEDGHHHTHHSHSRHRMMRKLHILLSSKLVSNNSKAARLTELFEELLSHVWLRSRHVALVCECFHKLGRTKKATHFGSYRTELVVKLFSRIIDPHNFELVMRTLEPYEAGCLVSRIGLLHIYNPLKPEGSWELDLGRYEERVVAKTLCALAVVEPGDNWPQKQFRWARDQDYMPGWELVSTWMTDEGMPKRGIITVEYYSGGGTLQRECKPEIRFRKALLQLVRVDEEVLVPEDEDKIEEDKLVGLQHFKNYSDMWYSLLITKE